MSTPAGGLAKILDDLSNANHDFIARETGDVTPVDGAKTINGGWDRDGTGNSVDWTGDNPEMTADTDDTEVTSLEVRYGTDATDRIVVIPHTGVSLDDGDTIEYTLVRIQFNTNAIP